jgi:hypothetical protein
MAYTALTKIDPIIDGQYENYTTTATGVADSAEATPSINMQRMNKVRVQVTTTVNAAAGTDTVTTKLQGSNDNTGWFDLPTVASTGQVGTDTFTAASADATDVAFLQYDFSGGSAQAPVRYVRASSISDATNGNKDVTVNFLLVRE